MLYQGLLLAGLKVLLVTSDLWKGAASRSGPISTSSLGFWWGLRMLQPLSPSPACQQPPFPLCLCSLTWINVFLSSTLSFIALQVGPRMFYHTTAHNTNEKQRGKV